MKAILLALVTVTVGLAGCVGDEAPTGGVDGEAPVSLGSNGAITGLVVDDNYRPVQLKEEWGSSGPGEFQDIGFVLILETGQRFETSENGEFNVLPLKPGKYTIRVAADNHEAKDTAVNVVSGEYTEITLEARRTFSAGGSVLSQEEVLFMACYGSFHTFSIALASAAAGCGDLSGDSSRFDFNTDQPELQPDVRALITEMRSDRDWDYSVTIRNVGDDACPTYCYYASAQTEMGRYTHTVLYPELQWVETGVYLEDGQDGYCKVNRDEDCLDGYAFTMEIPFQTALFASQPNGEYVQPVCPYTQEYRDIYSTEVGFPPMGCGGVGVIFGVKAQFVQNIFLYELPEDGIEDYCVLCDDANIPE